jgi:hypothetical protein
VACRVASGARLNAETPPRKDYTTWGMEQIRPKTQLLFYVGPKEKATFGVAVNYRNWNRHVGIWTLDPYRVKMGQTLTAFTINPIINNFTPGAVGET